VSWRARLARVAVLVARAWRFLRVLSGDADYEIYLERSRGAPPLSRQAFYLERLRRRYRGPNRCC